MAKLEGDRKSALEKAHLRLQDELISKAGSETLGQGSENGSRLPLDDIPSDPAQRTRDYIIEQASLHRETPTNAQPRHLPNLSLNQGYHADPAPRDFPADQSLRMPNLSLCQDAPRPERMEPGRVAREVLHHMNRGREVSVNLARFSDKPHDYRGWKLSFQRYSEKLYLDPLEETDMLIKWLGQDSSVTAKKLKNLYLDEPEKGLEEIWRRLNRTYGAPEVLERNIKEKVAAFPKIGSDLSKLSDLSDLLNEVRKAKANPKLRSLAAYDGALGIEPIINKLPQSIKSEWASYGARYKRNNDGIFPPFDVFAGFIEQQAVDRNDPSFIHCAATQADRPIREVSVHKTEVSSKDYTRHCPLHQDHHPLRNCRAFKAKPLQERRTFFFENNLCFRCCSAGHRVIDCRSPVKCDHCGSERHHTALHSGPFSSSVSTRPVPLQSGEPTPTHSGEPTPTHSGERENVTTFFTQVDGGRQWRQSSKICLVKVHPAGDTTRTEKMYAVIDDNSNRSLAHPDFFDLFDDHSLHTPYSLKTCGGVLETAGRRAQGYRIQSLDERVNLPLPTLIECSGVVGDKSTIPTPEATRYHPHLAHITDQIPEFDPKAPVLLLLGRDLIEIHKVRKHINGPPNKPHAQKLDLGWVIVGDLCPENPTPTVSRSTRPTKPQNSARRTTQSFPARIPTLPVPVRSTPTQQAAHLVKKPSLLPVLCLMLLLSCIPVSCLSPACNSYPSVASSSTLTPLLCNFDLPTDIISGTKLCSPVIVTDTRIPFCTHFTHEQLLSYAHILPHGLIQTLMHSFPLMVCWQPPSFFTFTWTVMCTQVLPYTLSNSLQSTFFLHLHTDCLCTYMHPYTLMNSCGPPFFHDLILSQNDCTISCFHELLLVTTHPQGLIEECSAFFSTHRHLLNNYPITHIYFPTRYIRPFT